MCPFEILVRFLPQEGRIVEFGCGIGLFSNFASLFQPSLTVVGYDQNKRDIDIAKRSVNGRKNIIFDLMDIRTFDQTEPFDAVAMIDCIHHVPYSDQDNVFKIAWNALKPGGLLFIKDIDESPRWMVWANYAHDRIQNHPPFLLKNKDLERLMESNRFSIQSVWRGKNWYIPHIAYIAHKES